jgi:hypothetical protein
LNSARVSETQQALLQFHVTGRYPSDTALISTTSFFFPGSPQCTQCSPHQDPPWEKKTILRYCGRRAEDMANTICAERRTTCGMERERRSLVGYLVFLFLFTTEPLAALYNRSPPLQYLFLRKARCIRTPLLDGRMLSVNPNMVRHFHTILIHLAEHPTCRTGYHFEQH